MKLTKKLKQKLLNDYLIEVCEDPDVRNREYLIRVNLLTCKHYGMYNCIKYNSIEQWFKDELTYDGGKNSFNEHLKALAIKKEKDLLNSLVSTKQQTNKKVIKL